MGKNTNMKAEIHTSLYKKGVLCHEHRKLIFGDDKSVENCVINIYPDVRYQVFEGFGGAVTDATGYVFCNMSDENQKKMVRRYFGKGGVGYAFVRIPIDSCDFSLGQYEAMSDKNDTELSSFDISRNGKHIFPLLRAISDEIGKPIPIMLTPWSPPGFMKRLGLRIGGGRLYPEFYDMWASYICRFITEMTERGYMINRLSLQNEPNARQVWDSCQYSADEEKRFLKDSLFSRLEDAGFGDIEIFIWDHNKERLYERACDIIDRTTDSMIDGVAFHWYSGDHFEAVRLVSERFPGKKLILTEACIEYNRFDKGAILNNAKMYAHDIIGNLCNGMNAFYDWNILLDSRGGPNYVRNFCEAPMMYDERLGTLRENASLAYIEHFSGYIKPGAVRIAHTCFTHKLECVAFENPNGESVLVVFNPEDTPNTVNIRIKREMASIKVAPESITTIIIRPINNI